MSQSLTTIESAFGDKLASNYVPNDEEVAIIKELLLEPDKELETITGEIEDLKAQLGKLLKEKEELNDQVKAHKALLSPARRLPPDVVQKIFLYCLPTERNPTMSSKDVPLLLGRICSQWRDISLSTPRLWAAIHIAIPTDPPVPMPLGGPLPPPPPPPQSFDHVMRIQAITAWLSRSDPCPLSISLFSSRYDTVVNNSVQLYLDAILTFSSRWKHIHMSLAGQLWNNFLPRIREDDVPILEKIYLDSGIIHSMPNSPTFSSRDSGFLKAASVRSVSLIQFDPHILHVPLRWNRLTELNLSGSIPSWQPTEGLSVTESLSILFLCSNLEYFSVQLSLAGFTPMPNGEYGLPKVTMGKLRGLAVTETNNVDSAPFFEHILTPALRHLKFRRSSLNSYISVPDLAQMGSLRAIYVTMSLFLRQVNGLIESFELDALYMTEEDVMKCLSLMPGLKKLALWSYGSSGVVPSPYALPAATTWETTLFTFGDKHLKRFMPHLAGDNTADELRPGEGSAQSTLDENDSSRTGESDMSSVTVSLPLKTPSPILLDPPTVSETTPEDNIGITNGTSTSSSVAELMSPLIPTLKDEGGDGTTGRKLTEAEGPTDILCPLLEEFQCSAAIFSDETMLAFLRARSSLASTIDPNTTSTKNTLAPLPPSSPSPPPTPQTSPGESSSSAAPFINNPPQKLAHLRRCCISFCMGHEEPEEIKEKLEEIRKETGMKLEVHYPAIPAPLYKPYKPHVGLPSVPVLGAGPGVDAAGITTINVNGLSGEPVFLYSAAFY